LPLLQGAGVDVILLERLSPAEVLRDRPNTEPMQSLLSHRGNPFGVRLVQLASVLARLRPRAVIAQLDRTNLLAGTAALLAGVPRVVLSFRNFNPSKFSYLSCDWYLPIYQSLIESPRVLLSGNSRAA